MHGSSAEAPPPIDPGQDALFLDFDGTLAELVDHPGDAVLAPGLEEMLVRACERLAGRVAILSGRSLADLAGRVPPGLAMAGTHGLELRTAGGEMRASDPHPGIEAARAPLAELAEQLPGLMVEDKGLAIALHFRTAPAIAAEVQRAAERLAGDHALKLQPGKMVFELRAPGPDKGTALAELLAAPPFAGFRPCFAGDDLTDEPGFATAGRLGGHGILVGAPRPTAARFRLADVAAVADWLAR
jgi:trehalose 6-phosphate phosphatase